MCVCVDRKSAVSEDGQLLVEVPARVMSDPVQRRADEPTRSVADYEIPAVPRCWELPRERSAKIIAVKLEPLSA